MAERRRELRQRSLLGASLSFNRGQITTDCVVHNVSGGGALVLLPHATTVDSGDLRLHIRQRGELHVAHVVWRHGDKAGLALTGAGRPAAALDGSLRLRRLIAENRRLRRQLDPGRW